MKKTTALVLACVMSMGICLTGCEVTHTETHDDTLFGGHKEKETTVIENKVTGDTSVKQVERRTP